MPLQLSDNNETQLKMVNVWKRLIAPVAVTTAAHFQSEGFLAVCEAEPSISNKTIIIDWAPERKRDCILHSSSLKEIAYI